MLLRRGQKCKVMEENWRFFFTFLARKYSNSEILAQTQAAWIPNKKRWVLRLVYVYVCVFWSAWLCTPLALYEWRQGRLGNSAEVKLSKIWGWRPHRIHNLAILLDAHTETTHTPTSGIPKVSRLPGLKCRSQIVWEAWGRPSRGGSGPMSFG